MEERSGSPLKLRPMLYRFWRELSPKGTIPSLRQGHAIAVLKDKAYLFGGSALSQEEQPVFYNDLYSLTLTSSETTWEAIEQCGEIPSAREGHSLIVIESNIFLFGGVHSETADSCVKDIHVLDIATSEWSVRETTGPFPEATSSSYVSDEDGHVIVFGGVFKGKACNETRILDTGSFSWVLAETTGSLPVPRCDHGCSVLNRKMFVFGGSAGESLWLNDLHYLNLESLQWVSLGELDHTPSPRDYPSMLSLTCKGFQHLVLFGGFSSIDGTDVCLNDSYTLSTSSKVTSWNALLADEDDTPLPPGRYGHVAFTFGNKVFLHGGQDTEKMFNDLWMIEFEVPEIVISPTVPPRKNYKTETPVPVPRRNLPPPFPKEIEPRDFNTLRTQYTGQINEIFNSLAKKFEELDKKEKMLEAEREQFEEEKKELHETYDRQQREVAEVVEDHKRVNEEWIEEMRQKNDEEKRSIAEEKAELKKQREELEKEKTHFQEKSIKLDNIMKQVKGLTS